MGGLRVVGVWGDGVAGGVGRGLLPPTSPPPWKGGGIELGEVDGVDLGRGCVFCWEVASGGGLGERETGGVGRGLSPPT